MFIFYRTRQQPVLFTMKVILLVIAAILALEVANASSHLYVRVNNQEGNVYSDHIMTIDPKSGAATEVMKTYTYSSGFSTPNYGVSDMTPDGVLCYTNGYHYASTSLLLCANVNTQTVVAQTSPSDSIKTLNYDKYNKRLLAASSNGTNQYLVSWTWDNNGKLTRQNLTDLGTTPLSIGTLDAQNQVYYWISSDPKSKYFSLSWVSVDSPNQPFNTVTLKCEKIMLYSLQMIPGNGLYMNGGVWQTWDSTMYGYLLKTSGYCSGGATPVDGLSNWPVLLASDPQNTLYVDQATNLMVVKNGVVNYVDLTVSPISMHTIPRA